MNKPPIIRSIGLRNYHKMDQLSIIRQEYVSLIYWGSREGGGISSQLRRFVGPPRPPVRHYAPGWLLYPIVLDQNINKNCCQITLIFNKIKKPSFLKDFFGGFRYWWCLRRCSFLSTQLGVVNQHHPLKFFRFTGSFKQKSFTYL